MRVQTTFEKIAEGANRNLFAWCFVALRIVAGLTCLYFAFYVLQTSVTEITAEPGTPLYDYEMADVRFLVGYYVPFVAAVGLSFVLGLFVRPVSIVCMLTLVVFGSTSGSIYPVRVLLTHLVIALVFAVFAAGGSGHALGLDGIISRNIRRPNAFTKFLFG